MSISGADIHFELEGRPLHFYPVQEHPYPNIQEHLDPNIIECNSNEKRGYLLTATLPPSMALPRTFTVLADEEPLDTPDYKLWEWKPPLGFAGLSHLSIQVDGQPLLETYVRVFPEKVTLGRYEYMLSDISRTSIDLLLKLNPSLTEHAIIQQREQDSSALREYTLLNRLIGDFEDIMFHIRRQPYQVLKGSYQQQNISHIRDISGEHIPLAGTVRMVPAIPTTPYLPEAWLVRENSTTYDIYENQLLKHFIQQQLFSKISFIISKVHNEILMKENKLTMARTRNWRTTLPEEIAQLRAVEHRCQQMIQQCNAWAGETFLQSVKQPSFVGKATQVLLRHQHYSRFFQLYLRFQEELRIELNTSDYIADLSMQKVCNIYEIWSVFTVTSILIDQLRTAGYVIDQHKFFFEVQKDTFHFTVGKNTPSVVLSKGKTRIEVKYEPIYRNMSDASVQRQEVLGVSPYDDRQQLTPDMAIEVYEEEQPKNVIILDVKYKWEKKGDEHAPCRKDKRKMLDYYHYIYRKTRDPQGHLSFDKVVSYAYIIYPGDQTHQDRNNPIGALPLIPNMPIRKKEGFENALKTLLKHSGLP
jgi:hypothetical protein